MSEKSEVLEPMEALINIIQVLGSKRIKPDKYENEYKIIKEYILKTHEIEKALKIIKEKNVDIFFIKSCKTIEQYNLEICNNSPFAYGLTEEEFELLKQYFKKYIQN